jgi:hypothetical protein
MKLQFDRAYGRTQPDPFVCQIGDKWYMYVTALTGVEAYWADSPLGRWHFAGNVLEIPGCSEYWAPCVIRLGEWIYMYTSCKNDDFFQYLHVARSKDPLGPFGEPKCLFSEFTIDAHAVQTEKGLFLWYAKDNMECDRAGTMIYIRQMLDPYTPSDREYQMLAPSFDEEIYMRDRYVKGQNWHTLEGPFWLQKDGYQYLMYSGACYENDTYHIGYAVAKTDEQDLTQVRFKKHTNNGKFVPLMTKNAIEEGVGHHSVIFYKGEYYAVYHARDIGPVADGKERRTARICALTIQDGLITARPMEEAGMGTEGEKL